MPEPDYPSPVDCIYPVHLPAPHASVLQPAERRLLSDVQAGPQQVRGVQRDYLASQELEFVLSAAEAEDFRAWFEETLTHGGAWFAAEDWPAPHRGLAPIARRFMAAPQWRFIASGLWRVSARFQVRGAGRPPKVLGCVPWVQVGEPLPAAAPALFGSGVYCALDPLSGYIWSTWRSGGGDAPPAALPAVEGAFSGSYVLVYDPATMSLVDSIRIGASATDFMCIQYFGGSFYIGIEGNSWFPGSGGDPLYVITQIDAATRAITGFGNTNYGGAVSKLGLISKDASELYISIVNGVGAGTSLILNAAPYPRLDIAANSDWVFNSVFNPITGVRCYTGKGNFVDFKGAVSMTVDTSAYFTSPATPSKHRLIYKTCSPYIFVMSAGSPSVLRIHTLTGAVEVVTATMVPQAMYYSPESGILYVDGADPADSEQTVIAFDGDTFDVVGEFPGYEVANGLDLGNSVYIGAESFVACESTSAPSSRMWRVSFPH